MCCAKLGFRPCACCCTCLRPPFQILGREATGKYTSFSAGTVQTWAGAFIVSVRPGAATADALRCMARSTFLTCILDCSCLWRWLYRTDGLQAAAKVRRPLRVPPPLPAHTRCLVGVLPSLHCCSSICCCICCCSCGTPTCFTWAAAVFVSRAGCSFERVGS